MRQNSLTKQGPRRVPEISAHFWAIKLLTTAMGEALSDYLVQTIDPVIAVGIGFLALIIAFAIQFKVKHYVPWAYWLAVSMVAVFGTMAADVLHVGIGIPYWVSSIMFAVCLAIVFIAWKRVEGTLSVHSITTKRREIFYWLTVLSTFALGTAAGDMSATTFHLGYLGSIAVFLLIILTPALLRVVFKMNEVFTFWFAYILTRPLGASIADWLGISKHFGGLGFGRGTVSLVLIAIIVIYVSYISYEGRGKSRIFSVK